MSAFLESLRGAADSFLPPLVSHLWSSTLFLLLVLAVLFALRRRLTASARFALALVGILKFAIPGTFVMHGVRFVAGDLFRFDAPAAFVVPLSVVGGVLPLAPVPAVAAAWPAVVVSIWLAVALALIARSTLTRHRLVAHSMRTALPPQPREVEALERACRRLGVRGSIDIARSALPEAPAVLRTFRPVIVLPAGGCGDLSDDELEALLCHECAHVARYDNFVALIESFIGALFWFDPVIWIAQRVMVIERERACDEAVAGLAGERERETYLAALSKFCHAVIVPRLPGVSCMATARLKERMDHVMNYPALEAKAPSARRVTVLACAALVLFTLVSGIAGSERAFAGDSNDGPEPYSIKVTATRFGDDIALEASISESATQKVVAAPRLTFEASTPYYVALTSGPGLNISIEVRPRGESFAVDVELLRDGTLVQRVSVAVAPSYTDDSASVQPGPEEQIATGEPISIILKDANLRDAIGTFGRITGLKMQMDDSVQGKVSVKLKNVPWDQAFDSILKDNGMTYRIEDGTAFISKQ